MALNKNDRSALVKVAETKGYSWSSSGNAMNNGSNTMKFSSTGGSVKIGGSTYTDASNAKKSKSW
jgi:hypothetical protein